MTDIMTVGDAIVERALLVLDGWNAFPYELSPMPLPALSVKPQQEYADYVQSMNSHACEWSFWLGMYLNAQDEDACRRQMAELTDPSGPLITTLKDRRIDDRLAELCRGMVRVTKGRGFTVKRTNNQRILYAETGLQVVAN